MREMLMNFWRNATHWACLTGIIVVSIFFFLFFCQLRCAKTPNTNHYVLLINSIASLAVAQNMRELYRLVLVDTPLAPYFSECITSEVNTAADHLCITSVL
jgi:nicotinamide riboside transporter PnuC